MAERHYDDEALISLIETGRTGADVHLPSCKTCREKLDSFRDLSGILHDASVWDRKLLNEEPVPSTIANLRAFADRMTAEDTRAEAYLNDLLAGPREEWMPRLQQHPEYRTAGVVRKLIAAVSRAVDTMPPDAVEITRLATEIADHVAPTMRASDETAKLRGAAWRERAFALLYTGAFPEALLAVERADAEFSRCIVDEFDRARVGVVKSLILRAFEKFDDAQPVVSRSAALFQLYGDLERTASATMAQAHLLFSRSDFEGANKILTVLELRLRESGNVETHARVLANLGYAARKMGNVDRAVQYYDLSTQIFDVLGITTELNRNRLNAAVILAEAGRLPDAQSRFETVLADFDSQGMTEEATLARLDIAEILLAQERFVEVEALCQAAMRSLERAGLEYTSRALTALAFMREAAGKRTVTQNLVRGVRDYIKKLPSQPTLQFAFGPK